MCIVSRAVNESHNEKSSICTNTEDAGLQWRRTSRDWTSQNNIPKSSAIRWCAFSCFSKRTRKVECRKRMPQQHLRPTTQRILEDKQEHDVTKLCCIPLLLSEANGGVVVTWINTHGRATTAISPCLDMSIEACTSSSQRTAADSQLAERFWVATCCLRLSATIAIAFQHRRHQTASRRVATEFRRSVRTLAPASADSHRILIVPIFKAPVSSKCST